MLPVVVFSSGPSVCSLYHVQLGLIWFSFFLLLSLSLPVFHPTTLQPCGGLNHVTGKQPEKKMTEAKAPNRGCKQSVVQRILSITLVY